MRLTQDTSDRYLKPLDVVNFLTERGAKELVMRPGSPPAMMVSGREQVLDLPPLDERAIGELVAQLLDEESWRAYQACGTCDVTVECYVAYCQVVASAEGARFICR